jgi:hypothetical protein
MRNKNLVWKTFLLENGLNDYDLLNGYNNFLYFLMDSNELPAIDHFN